MNKQFLQYEICRFCLDSPSKDLLSCSCLSLVLMIVDTMFWTKISIDLLGRITIKKTKSHHSSKII